MQQFIQMMQMRQFNPQFQPNQNLFQNMPNMGSQRFEMEGQNPFSFQSFPNNQFFNPQLPNNNANTQILL